MNLNSLDCELNDSFQNPKISLINTNAISEIPEDLLFTQLSFYKNALAKKPEKTCSVKNILEHISSGQWISVHFSPTLAAELGRIHSCACSMLL